MGLDKICFRSAESRAKLRMTKFSTCFNIFAAEPLCDDPVLAGFGAGGGPVGTALRGMGARGAEALFGAKSRTAG